MAINYRKEVDSGFDRKRMVETCLIQLLKEGFPAEMIQGNSYYIYPHDEMVQNLNKGYYRKLDQLASIYERFSVDVESMLVPDSYSKVTHPVGGELYPLSKEEQKSLFEELEACRLGQKKNVFAEQKRLEKEKEKLLKTITKFKVKNPQLEEILDLTEEIDKVLETNRSLSAEDMSALYKKHNMSSKYNSKYQEIYNQYKELTNALSEITLKYEAALNEKVTGQEYFTLKQRQIEIETELIRRNTKLVNAFIRQKYADLLVDSDELFQICYVGLWNAIKEYDHRKASFSTYAYVVMDGEVKKNFKDLTGLSWYNYWGKKKVNRLLQLVSEITGHEVDVIDLVNYGLLPMTYIRAEGFADVADILDMSDVFNVEDGTYEEYERDTEYNYYFEDDEITDFSPIYNVMDEKGTPASEVNFASLQKDLNEVLNSLSEREKTILQLRFGLIDGVSITLEEVAKELNITRERARQIENHALRKLHYLFSSGPLKDYLDEDYKKL